MSGSHPNSFLRGCMMKNPLVLGFAIVGLVMLPAIGAAKNPPPASPLISALEACRAIADAEQRLACYDKSTEALVTAARKGDVTVVSREDTRAARRSLFGFGMPKLPFFAGDESADEASDTLDTTIKQATAISYGKFRIVVAEGNAVWETTETYATMREPKAGQKILIKRGPLGSYMLKIAGQRAVKGRRVG